MLHRLRPLAAETLVKSRHARAEALATLREVALLGSDLLPIVPEARPGADVVVLVHGFMASAGVFRPMRARLERETGAVVASFSHAPGFGVRRIAGQLASLVDRLPRDARIHLVGHSLGGVVARWYVQEMGGHARIAQTISLATPFRGSSLAERFPVLVGNDLHAASDVVKALRDGAHAHPVPHLSIVGLGDRVVSPPETAEFYHGEVVRLDGLGHNTLLFDPDVIGLVVSRVQALRAASVTPPAPASGVSLTTASGAESAATA